MLFKVFLALLFVGTYVEASKKLTSKFLGQFKNLKSEMKQILYMAGYHQGRTHEKLDRLLEKDQIIGKEQFLPRLRALEKLVKKHKKENDRRFLEKKDDHKTIIAFTVSLSSNLARHDNKKIIYDKVITNTGNAYNKITGIFTCTVPGTYVFTWSTMSKSASEYCYAYLFLNGSKKMMAHAYDSGIYEVASNTMVLTLKVGDLVWIGTTHGKYCYGYPFTGFSGWKL